MAIQSSTAVLLMVEILRDIIDLIYQKYRNSGSIVHIYIYVYVYQVTQDFHHQPYESVSSSPVSKPSENGWLSAQ